MNLSNGRGSSHISRALNLGCGFGASTTCSEASFSIFKLIIWFCWFAALLLNLGIIDLFSFPEELREETEPEEFVVWRQRAETAYHESSFPIFHSCHLLTGGSIFHGPKRESSIFYLNFLFQNVLFIVYIDHFSSKRDINLQKKMCKLFSPLLYLYPNLQKPCVNIHFVCLHFIEERHNVNGEYYSENSFFGKH